MAGAVRGKDRGRVGRACMLVQAGGLAVQCAFGVERVAGQLHPGQGYEAADGPGSGSCGCGRLYRMSTQPSP